MRRKISAVVSHLFCVAKSVVVGTIDVVVVVDKSMMLRKSSVNVGEIVV